MNIHPRAYEKAFQLYLRYGFTKGLELKEDSHPTTHYIWRTSDDDKVRPSHAANEGKLFPWKNPPATGHPGEHYSCRCRAEDYYGLVDTLIGFQNSQQERVIAAIRQTLENTPKWLNKHFSLHYYFGEGKGVTLKQVGYLEEIKAYYEKVYFQIFIDQFITKAKLAPYGIFVDEFENGYDFEEVIYSYRESTVAGTFYGSIYISPSGERKIRGIIKFKYYDEFQDPASIAQSTAMLVNIIPFIPDITEQELPEIIKYFTKVGGTPYSVTDEWEMEFEERSF